MSIDKRVFAVLFLNYMDFHFFKDVGQIPYSVQKYSDYKSKIICFKNDNYTETNRHLEIEFLNKFGFPEVPNNKVCKNLFRVLLNKYTIPFVRTIILLLYFMKNSKSIDVLYTYQFFKNYYDILLCSIFYKKVNPKGKLVIRFEADLNDIGIEYPYILFDNTLLGKLKYFFFSKLYKKYYNIIDVFGVIDFNSLSKFNSLHKLNSLLNCHVVSQLNGFNKSLLNEFVGNVKSFEEKENIIVVAGRLDDPIKGIDVFLDALKVTNIDTWKIYLLGSSDAILINQLNEFINNNSHLKDKIINYGYIKTKKEYYEILNKSKIFVVASRADGIPIVVPEAMALGNLIISSNHHGMRIVTENGTIGRLFEIGHFKQLSKVLDELINDQNLLKDLSAKSYSKAHKDLEWEKIVQNLIEL